MTAVDRRLRRATSVPLHLTVDPWWDLIAAVAHGRVDDGLPACQLVESAGECLQFILDRPGRGPVIGFVVPDAGSLHPDLLTAPEIWHGPRFDVPVLGLSQASAGEILLAVWGRYEPDEPTAGAMHFHLAIDCGVNGSDLEAMIGQWRLALEAGEMKALFGLGCTLVEAGRPREAYDVLRRYTELTPRNAWAWCWLGRACAALGETEEARAAFERALDNERRGSFSTDARELLSALG